MGWARAFPFFIPHSQFSLVVARLQWDCKCSCFASSISTWSMTSLMSALPSVASSSSSGLRLRASKVAVLRSFTGLAPPKPLLRTIASPEFSSFEHCFTTIDNGGRVFAMRHGRRVPKLPLTNAGHCCEASQLSFLDTGVSKLLEPGQAQCGKVPDRYGERNGGYTRIVRTLPTRQGDNAPMAYIELV
ncbi:hypothetical protein L3X38_030550 [Prunus dulcis]|uniref:Ribosomal protein L17 family protein n=1 Tax=Prunus dulcis TaxID=3755 RepID=A0AAD4VAF3_PRUDU|nr:hypothetical protein L3X38_030550 [Prunus dulcis]